MTPQPPVTLENCDQEPIHIPGLVQPHGALVAFDSHGRVTHVSANAPELLGPTVPSAGELLQSHHLGGMLHPLPGTGDDVEGLPSSLGVELDGRAFDLVVHRSDGLTIAEFEKRVSTPDEAADFALKAHRAMERLKRQPSIDSLLRIAVEAVRQLTGFDRVMAYRFRHDDSGDVVAESRIESLEPFVGRRYPASDIPAQARRLYLINTLRLVADVGAVPVALLAAPGVEAPLDMSHCVLRSVSPIHIEYLRNMGVRASMSISIVVNGALWGMLACHHMAPLRASYSVRMACDVLAQILAANVQSLLAREQALLAASAAQLRARVVEATLHADDAVAALTATAAGMLVAFDAHALVIAGESRLHAVGDLPAELPARLVQWLDARLDAGQPLVQTDRLAEFAPELSPVCGVWRGMLALCFDPGAHGWLVLLRKEQVETIQWGGKPDKHYEVGPLGARLTPRGSFDLWRETVRDLAVPWTPADVDFAQLLLNELTRAGAARSAEVARGRRQLMTLLGADALRSAGASGSEEPGSAMANARTATLIGQVLDVSRLQSGAGLELQFETVDLGVLLRELLADARKADPDVTIYFEGPKSLMVRADGVRLKQVFGHLIGNARHHGAPGEAVMVQLGAPGDGAVVLDVSNVSPPIPPDVEAQLFSAFRPTLADPARLSRSRTGLGVGLHIAQAIALAHGGSIEYNHADPFVVFSVRLPIVVVSG